MQYDLVFAETRKDLVNEVNRLIGEGWVPQGGIAIAAVVFGEGLFQKESFIYAQAMIRHPQDEG